MSSSPGVEEKSTGTPKQRRKDAAHHGKKRHTRRLAGRSTSLSNLSEAYQRPRSATVAGGPTPRTQGGRCAPPIRPLSAPAPSHSLRIAADDDSDPWSLLSDTKIDRSDWQSKALVEAPTVNELVARVGPFQRARDFVDVYERGKRQVAISKKEMNELVYQFLVAEGYTEAADLFMKESGTRTFDFSSGDVRLKTLLRILISWTERVWDLAMNDKQMGIEDAKEAVESLLDGVGLLRVDEDGRSSLGSGNIWEEPLAGNIIWETKTGEEVLPSPRAMGGERKPEVTLATEREIADKHKADDSLTLRAASLNKLVEELTPIQNPNNEFTKVFLLTYGSFTTPLGLLAKLRQRYDVPRGDSVDEAELRVINTLKLWLEFSFHEFDARFFAQLRDFIDHRLIRDHPGQVKALLSIIDKKKTDSEDVKLTYKDPPPPPIIPKGFALFHPSLDWTSLDAVEIARQLTLIEFDFFRRIQSSEFIKLAWSKPKLKSRAPHLLRMIEHFNNVSTWVSTLIIHPSKIKERVKAWTKLIQIAQHLLALNNFSSLMAFLGGFSNIAVYRLKHTREGIPQTEQNAWIEMRALMDSDGGFANFRARLEQTVNPCIPGVFLTDLTFTEDGNEDDYKGLINFTKRRLIGTILQRIKNYQSLGYNLQPVQQIQTILTRLEPRWSEEEQIKYSVEREAKRAKRKDIA